MLSLEDSRWTQLRGGYRVPYDPRPALLRLESGKDTKTVWEELWQELYHQGDVGEASYAAIPHLVRIYRRSQPGDWNTYAMLATVELARREQRNPAIPDWLQEDYDLAWKDLAETGLAELKDATNREVARSILAVLALWKGLGASGGLLIDFTEDELIEMRNQYLGVGDDKSAG
jgi:hypothetical protein